MVSPPFSHRVLKMNFNGFRLVVTFVYALFARMLSDIYGKLHFQTKCFRCTCTLSFQMQQNDTYRKVLHHNIQLFFIDVKSKVCTHTRIAHTPAYFGIVCCLKGSNFVSCCVAGCHYQSQNERKFHRKKHRNLFYRVLFTLFPHSDVQRWRWQYKRNEFSRKLLTAIAFKK